MAIEYLGLNSVNGPFVVLEGVKGAAYDEIVEIVADGKEKKLGRIVEINEDKAVVQVFEGTDNLSLKKYPYQTDWTSDGNRADGSAPWQNL